MRDSLIGGANVNQQYAKMLLDDVPPEKMAFQPVPGVNHPAWIMGHLAWAYDSAAAILGAESQLPAGWKELFASGTSPAADAARYPQKQMLLDEFQSSFARLVEAFRVCTPESLERPFPHERMRRLLPTVGVAVVHILTTHAGVHLGQLSAWRRMQGLPPLF